MHQQQTAYETIVRKGEIARNEQFLLFPRFLPNQITVSPFFHIFDTISLFPVEFEKPKIGITGLNKKSHVLTSPRKRPLEDILEEIEIASR